MLLVGFARGGIEISSLRSIHGLAHLWKGVLVVVLVVVLVGGAGCGAGRGVGRGVGRGCWSWVLVVGAGRGVGRGIGGWRKAILCMRAQLDCDTTN
jgi:hypothetical protein